MDNKQVSIQCQTLRDPNYYLKQTSQNNNTTLLTPKQTTLSHANSDANLKEDSYNLDLKNQINLNVVNYDSKDN